MSNGQNNLLLAPSHDNNFCFTLQRKNEFLQRSSKPDDKEIEKQRVTNKLTSQGKEGSLADRVQPMLML